MSIIQRFSDNQRGAIVITGNTLGLSRQRFTQNPGTDNAINQFISTNSALPVPPAWSSIVNTSASENITFNWLDNSSSAFLNMLAGYTVLYAELIWGGMSISLSTGSNPPVDVSSSINNPITLTAPNGTYQVSPDPSTSQTAVIPNSGTFYIRTQDVTNIVAGAGIGKYTVGGVPSAININEVNTLNHAGWTLIVAYKNTSLPPRNLNIYVGEELINNTQFTDVTISGFLTPPSGTISARISVAAQEGDAVITGDQMLFGPNSGSLVALSGINNPSNNFFCSQINIGDPNNSNVGKIDPAGTFGGRNANALTSTNITAGRQGWDITNVNASANLVNNQSSALIRITTSGDVYVLNTIGIQIDTILVTGTKTVDKSVAALGDTLTYTVNLTNEGGIPQSFTFKDPYPPGTSYVSGSLSASTTFTGDLVNGMVFTNIAPSQTVTITWQVVIGATIPNPNPILNTGEIYVTGLPVDYTNTVSTRIPNADMSIAKQAIPNPFVIGEYATYSITIQNLGPDSAQNVFVNDTIPTQLQNPEFSTDNGASWDPWPSLIGFGTLSFGQSKTFLIRGMLMSQANPDITNTATVTSTTPDPNPTNNTITITTDIKSSADIAVFKDGPAIPVIAGTQIQYSLLITNYGPSPSINVKLTDNIPTTITSPEYSSDNGTNWSPFVSPLTIGNLDLLESKTILIRGNVSTAAISDIQNTAVVSADTPDPDLSNNTSTVDTILNTQADISVVKTQSNNTPPPGSTLVYTVAINNIGPSDALNVKLADILSGSLINHEYSFNQITWQPWFGSFDFGTFIHNQTVTIYLRGIVNVPGVISNTATVTTDTFDPNLSNNTSTIETQLQNTLLSVNKSGSPTPVIAGNMITYTMVINNLTSIDALNVSISDALPSSITFPEYSLNGGSSWFGWDSVLDIGTIPGNTSITLLIRGVVKSSATGVLTNTAYVSSYNANTVQDTETTPINSSADIYLSKVGLPEPIIAGQEILYTINVGNNGPSDSVNVIFRDIKPDSINDDVMISYNFAPFVPWNPPYTITLGTLTQNTPEITIRIKGTVKSSTLNDFDNTATVTSNTFDPILSNNTSVFTSTVNASADLRIHKSINTSQIIAGQEIIYTLTVFNDGISDAQNVVITDALSNKITNAQYSFTGTAPWTDWLGSLDVGTVANKTSKILYIRCTVKSDSTGEIINEAIVSSTTPDPNPEDNKFILTTPIVTSADLSVVKSTLTNKPTAGLPIIYRILITNNGPSDSKDVVLSDVLVCNTLQSTYSVDGGATWLPWVSPLPLGDMAADDVVEVLISGKICPITTGSIENTASVTAATQDPDPNNNISTITIPIQALADLNVEKLAIPTPAVVGKHLTYSISVANFGPSNAVQVTLSDVLPNYLDTPEYSLDNGETWSEWTDSITIPILVTGALASILLRGIVNSSAIGKLISNTATVSSQTKDPNPANNTFTIISPVNNVSNLNIVKTADKKTVQLGETITYTITVNNLGPNVATDVIVTDILPSNLTNVEYSINDLGEWKPWTGEYKMGDLQLNSSYYFKLRGMVIDQNMNYVVNTALVTTSSQDIIISNNSSTVITTIINNNCIHLQQCIQTAHGKNCPLIIKFTITNWGPDDANDVCFINNLCPDIMNQKISIDNGKNWCPFDGHYYIGDLLKNQTLTLLLKGSIPSCLNNVTLCNNATIKTSNLLTNEVTSTLCISI